MRRVYLMIFMVLFGLSAKAQSDDICPDNKHPHVIDMGLPSGTKWACCNIGASSPEGYGGYFAWGERREREYYNKRSLSEKFIGYYHIGDDIAGTRFDAARYRWGSPWRMPTYEQFMELVLFCTMTWTTRNGVNGTLLTGPNGGMIFLPAAGDRWDTSLLREGEVGYYWSSTLRPYGEGRAYGFDFYSGHWILDDGIRGNGHSVRAVRP